MRDFTDASRTALLGLACGDSFGAPFEYHRNAPELASLSTTEGRYLDSVKDVGQRKIKWCRLPGLYTDDTQQALALMLAWHHRPNVEDAREFFINTCAGMANAFPLGQFGVHRGTGGNFRTAIMTGRPVDTAGLGAAMRVGPVATLFDDPQEMVEWVIGVSQATTSNPIALASAAKFAAVAWVLAHPGRRGEIQDVDWPEEHTPSQVWRATTAALRVVKADGEVGLLEFAHATGWANKPMSCAANGFALTGFPWAVNQALTAPSYQSALEGVCVSGGDTDTVAAMAGCLAALKHGEDAIPRWMLDGLKGREHILNPKDWEPIASELELTKLDHAYRNKLEAAARKRRKPKPPPEEGLDLFDFLEAEDPDPGPEPVLFGQKGDPAEFKCFSNFWQASFVLDGETWPDTEHYYMAQKNPDDIVYQQQIRAASTAWEAKKLGRACELRDGWDDIKYDIMFKAVRAKFEQNQTLRTVLLSTGERPIHENRPDPWWGGGPNYKGGRDWLGQILMDVRDLLRGVG